MCFRKCVCLVFCWKSRREKRGQRRIQGARNSGNPYAKVTIPVFYIFLRFRTVWKHKKIDKFQNLIRKPFVPTSSQKSFIWKTDKMNYGHYVRFEALWNAFELLCKSDLPPEIIEVIMIKAKMWFSNEIFETLQKEQCKIIEKFDEKSRVSSSLEKSDILAEELGTSKSTTYLDKEPSVTLKSSKSVGSVGNTTVEMLKNPEDLLKLVNWHSQEINQQNQQINQQHPA